MLINFDFTQLVLLSSVKNDCYNFTSGNTTFIKINDNKRRMAMNVSAQG